MIIDTFAKERGKDDPASPEQNIKLVGICSTPTVTYENILGAISRGYNSEENKNKVLDSDLCISIANEIHKLFLYRCMSDQTIVQLAWCLMAAEGATNNPAKPGDFVWSTAYQAVLDLRNKYDKVNEKNSDEVS